MLIDTLTVSRAASLLISDEYAAWSYAGAYALCEYLDQLSDDLDEPIEFDPVAFRCDFSEYASLWDWAEEYFTNPAEQFGIAYTDSQGQEYFQSVTDEDGNLHDEVLDDVKAYIEDRGTLIEFDGGIIVSSF